MIERFKVADRSMEPAFKEGNFVLIEKFSYLFGQPKENDVVILRHPHNQKFLLKRVVKTNNGAIPEKKLTDFFLAKKIPQDFLWYVEGDNKLESEDSRQFGPVGRKQIVGKLLIRIGGK